MLSLSPPLVGAVLGALLAYLVVTGSADQRAPPGRDLGVRRARAVRRRDTGVRVRWPRSASTGWSPTGARRPPGHRHLGTGFWLYELPGPDPRLHLLPDPADGDRLPAGPRGAAAAVARGGGQPRGDHVAVLDPGRRSRCSRPAFLGAMLLLFANAFAAYATAAALVSQGAPITPLLIRSALTSEVVLGQQNLGLRPGPRDGRRGGDRDDGVRLLLRRTRAVAAVRRAARRRLAGDARSCCSSLFGVVLRVPLLAMLELQHPGPAARQRAHRRRPGAQPVRRPGCCARRSSPRCCSPSLTIARHGGAAGADDDLGAAAGAAGVAARRVPLPAAAHHPALVIVVGLDERLRLGRLPHRRLGADAGLRLRHAGAALLLPRASTRRCPPSTCDHAGRGGPLARGRLVHRDRARDRAAEHLGRRLSARPSSPWRWCSASSPSPRCSTTTRCRWRSCALGKSDAPDVGGGSLASLAVRLSCCCSGCRSSTAAAHPTERTCR